MGRFSVPFICRLTILFENPERLFKKDYLRNGTPSMFLRNETEYNGTGLNETSENNTEQSEYFVIGRKCSETELPGTKMMITLDYCNKSDQFSVSAG